jgi:hypothetical protein
MRRLLPLLTVVATLIAVVALPTSASASTQPRATAAAATRESYGAVQVAELPGRSSGHAVEVPATTTGDLCLQNAQALCLGTVANGILDAVIGGITSAAFAYFFVLIGQKMSKKPEPEGEQEKGESQGQNDGNTGGAGLCFASTGGDVTLQSCGADGTVWIQQPYKDGFDLLNRYVYDNDGSSEVLTSSGNSNNSTLYVTGIASGDWQTWGWFNEAQAA